MNFLKNWRSLKMDLFYLFLIVYAIIITILLIQKVTSLSKMIKNEKESIDNRKATNQKLQKAYEIIERSSSIVFEWSIGPEAPAKYVSKNISLFGYTPEEFLTNKIDYWDFVYKEDVEKAREIVWGNRNKEIDEYKHMYRIVCKNGDIRWVEEWAILERNENGVAIEEKGILRDITEQIMNEEKIQKLTYNDKLTGLYNRLYYDIAINELFEKKEYPISIIMGDINGLKLTNDAFGHKAGDDLLILAAEIIKNSCRKQDIAARLSGDEFSVIMPGADKSEAELVCEKIRNASSNSSINQMCLSIALGHATTNSEINTMGEVLREAEDVMYRNKLNESRSIRRTIITTLQASLEQKTLETKEHAERIGVISLELGKTLGLSHDQMEELSIASSMHDIGKTGIPDSILSKPGALTEEEWQIMKKHPEIGYHILLSSPTMSKIAEYILSHHERWDGKGYPQGLAQEDIPLISRIIAIADTYDVMLSDRPYRNAVSKEEALDEIIRCSGTQFDPTLVKLFVRLVA